MAGSDMKKILMIGAAGQIGSELTMALRERYGGSFQGLTGKELQERFGEEIRQLRQNGFAPPNGESDQDVARRMEAVIRQIVNQHKGT